MFVLVLVLGLAVLTVLGVYNVVALRHLRREWGQTSHDLERGLVRDVGAVEFGRARSRGVLLLHGFATSPRDFGELPHRLADAGYRTSVPLLPGHGTHPTDLEHVTSEKLIEAVADAYAGLRQECDAVGIVGFSMGATLACHLVRDVKDFPPEAVVLASPYFGITYKWYAMLPCEVWVPWIAPFIPYVIMGESSIAVNRHEALRDIFAYNVLPTRSVTMLIRMAADLRANPPSLPPAHTLLMYSIRDGYASPGRTSRMADRWGIPESSRLILTESNHHVFHDHERQKAISRIVRFISESLGRTLP